MDDKIAQPRHWGHINSYDLYPSSASYIAESPLSTTSIFFFKFRKNSCPTSLKILSKYAKNIGVKLNKETIEDEVDSSEIKSFAELVKIQN